MAIETFGIDKTLHDTFTNDSLLPTLINGIEVGEVAEGTQFPYMLWDISGDDDVIGMGGIRIFQDIEVFLSFNSITGYYSLKAAYVQADLLMRTVAGFQSVEGVWIYNFVRKRTTRSILTDNGVRYYNITAIYKVIAYPG